MTQPAHDTLGWLTACLAVGLLPIALAGCSSQPPPVAQPVVQSAPAAAPTDPVAAQTEAQARAAYAAQQQQVAAYVQKHNAPGP